MAKSFASTADAAEKKISFTELAPNAFAYTADGDSNAGVVIGADGMLILDALATPVLAQTLLREIRKRSDKPVTWMVMSHYHAVRALGAAAFRPAAIIASRGTAEPVEERGAADFKSEVGRFPRLFEGVETVPGLTRPTIVFERELTAHIGKREIQILHLGRGHTRGDTVLWLPKEKLLYAGDLVEKDVAVYCGDAYLKDWPTTLDRVEALGARIFVPGRGRSLIGAKAVNGAIASTRSFVKDIYRQVSISARRRATLKQTFDGAATYMRAKYGAWPIFEHCIPFNVTRAFQEAKGVEHPAIWTASRDRAMWKVWQG